LVRGKLLQVIIYHSIIEFSLRAKTIHDILTLLKKTFAQENKVPKLYFEVQKLSMNLGMITHKYASVNDCILYSSDYLKSTSCPTCNFSQNIKIYTKSFLNSTDYIDWKK